MAHAVFQHRADSIYDDVPDARYDFPATYLPIVTRAIGDWIVYYEPVKAGPRGYFAVARVVDVIEKPGMPGRHIAVIRDYLPFDRAVPRLQSDARPWESALRDPSGGVRRGGQVVRAVRSLPSAEFSAIVGAGRPQDLVEQEAQQYVDQRGQIDPPRIFERPVIERLVSRPYRDVAFRRRVREAYGYRCAMSGLMLRNGGGRPEVEAAHIKPVARGGSDSVRNGLALSGTLHWMFDRGLLSVGEPRRGAERQMPILVSDNKVPRDVVDRLLPHDRLLHLPTARADWPDPSALAWHREHVFGSGDYAPPQG